MSKPQFAITTNYLQRGITLDEVGGSCRIHGGKQRLPRLYSKLRIINYFPDQAVNMIVLKRMLKQTGWRGVSRFIRHRTGAIKHGSDTLGCIIREEFLEKLSVC